MLKSASAMQDNVGEALSNIARDGSRQPPKFMILPCNELWGVKHLLSKGLNKPQRERIDVELVRCTTLLQALQGLSFMIVLAPHQVGLKYPCMNISHCLTHPLVFIHPTLLLHFFKRVEGKDLALDLLVEASALSTDVCLQKEFRLLLRQPWSLLTFAWNGVPNELDNNRIRFRRVGTSSEDLLGQRYLLDDELFAGAAGVLIKQTSNNPLPIHFSSGILIISAAVIR
mmetsp:Transcript_44372/g.117427  ORF Transcript_44372/g.117427 Transcript_44372/m.117427 type:complete len:228 (-) Transcript_44372:1517-2200(-)